jgi:mannosyltransferase
LKFDKGKILILLGFALTLFVRMNLIESKNMWFDELYSWNTAQYDIEGIVKAAAGDIHPPLYYIVLKGWISMFSDSVFSMRFLSVIFSFLSLIFIYRISKDILKDDVKVFFVIILYAFTPINIHYAQEVRMFMMNTFLCLGSVYYFMILLRSPGKRARTLFVLYSILAIYTHYFAFLIIITEGLIVTYRQIRAKSDLTTAKTFAPLFGVIILSYVPWFPEFLSQVTSGQPWRTPQDGWSLLLNTFAYFRDMFFSYFIYYKSTAIHQSANVVTIIIVMIYFALLFIAVKAKKMTGNAGVIAAFFVIPFIIAIMISYRNSLLLSRYISILIPYFLISFTVFTFALRNKKVSYTIIGVVLLASMAGTKFGYEMDFKNNDYREIISYLEDHYKEGDEVVVEPHYMGWSIKYLSKRGNTNLPTPNIVDYSLAGIVDSLKYDKNINKLWLVLDYSDIGRTGYDEIGISMKGIGFEMRDERTFEVIPDEVRVYYFVRE